MSSRTSRRYDREFKLAVVSRMEAGENVAALARELGVVRKLLYDWRRAYRLGGVEALRERGRPAKDVLVIAARDKTPSALQTPPSGYAQSTEQSRELAAARQRIAALERKIGQQSLEADFLNKALQLLETFHQPIGNAGGGASSTSWENGRSGKARTDQS